MHEFIHLRTQSCYSLLESTIKINNLVTLAAKHQMPAVALSDKNNMFASLEFAIEAKKNSIQPIHGVIIEATHYIHGIKFKGELLLIAKDKIGYQNLLLLVTSLYIPENTPTISTEKLAKFQEGIIVLSGYDKGLIGQLIEKGEKEEAKNYANIIKDILGDRFYFEIMRTTSKQKQIEAKYLELSGALDIPIVATNEVLFDIKEMHDNHDTLLCITKNCYKDESDRYRVSSECYFKSTDEMKSLFEDLPEALLNSVEIAQRCSFAAETHDPILPEFTKENEEELLSRQSKQGLDKRIDALLEQNCYFKESDKEKYYQRLEYELSIINKMGFPGYFLIVADFVKWSKDNGIIVGPGRGSGVGSIVSWSLNITSLDPIKFGLFFERFLNPERISMPDFDIDFCQKRRDEVLNYIRNKYGEERVAHIITFGSMKPKAVIKDVSRTLGLRYGIANYITDLIPFNAVNPVSLKQAINEVSELKKAFEGDGLYQFDEESAENNNELIKQVLFTALSLEGLPRHISTHAAGVVIGRNPLVEMLPLYTDGKEILIQYSMKYAELVGLVKFDFLGMQTLTVLDLCLKYLKKKNVDLDLDLLPLDDSKTYKLLSEARTAGVFQFESPGMREAIKKIEPNRIEDLMALTSLFRPGPMQNIPIYTECKKGIKEPDYLHPLLKDTLKETYGVIVYQEQVIEIAQILAGYTAAEADLLRRAMGKKIKKEMEQHEKKFVEGAVKKNVDLKTAKEIFVLVSKFAGYGFNKSHAAAYSLISYYTAYFKANYPIEFLLSCLNLDLNDSHKIALFLQELQSLGIKIRMPNINFSSSNFYYLDNEIIFALTAIRNVGIEAANFIEKERSSNGKFKDIFNFVERLPSKIINKKLLEGLILSGCFDSLNSNRKQLFENVTLLIFHNNSHRQKLEAQQFSLFQEDYSKSLAKIEDFSSLEKLNFEFDFTGLFLSGHPLTEFITNEYYDSKTIENLTYGVHIVDLIGVLVKKDNKISERGIYINLLLSDPFGYLNVTIFNEDLFKESNNFLVVKTPIVIKAEVRKDKNSTKITALSLNKLSEIQNQIITIKLHDTKNLDKLVNFLLDKKSLKMHEQILLELPINNKFFAKVRISNISLSLEDISLLENFIDTKVEFY